MGGGGQTANSTRLNDNFVKTNIRQGQILNLIVEKLLEQKIISPDDLSKGWEYYMPSYYKITGDLIYDYKKLLPILNEKNKFEGKDVVLVTFGDRRMVESAERIREQALKCNIFSKIYICNEDNLEHDFIDKMGDKLKYGSRGFGYWSWKPQIIKQVVNDCNEGDYIFYLDMGSHLYPSFEEEMIYLIKKLNASQHKRISFQLSCPEKQYTKSDLFDYMGVYSDDYQIHKNDKIESFGITGQQIGGTCMFLNNNNNKEFIQKWLDVYLNRYDLVTDIPSMIPNWENFIEHRHDQSILSLLLKKFGHDFEIDSKYNFFVHKRDKKFSDLKTIKK